MIGFLYILKSISKNQYYIGSTICYKERLNQHNQNLSKATKNKGPWKLVYLEKFLTIKQARQIEYQLKKKKSRKIIDQIIKDQKIKFMQR